MSRRGAAFAAVCAAIALIAGGYVGVALLRGAFAAPSTGGGTASGGDAALAGLLAEPHLIFLQPSGGDPTLNQLAVAPLQAPESQRVIVGPHCARSYFSGGRGVCLGETSAGAGHLLDAALRPGRAFLQPGVASRTRVSRDGRWASTTVFVAGHSYASGSFSTQTLLYDTQSGAATSLETFTVVRDGRAFQSPDFNFWGVTFASGGTFYATLGSGGQTFLIRGDVDRHSATVLRDGVECPDLSPDGSRLVYKSRLSGGAPIVRWRLHVLDLGTMADQALGETRSVDDQVEWLDDQSVLYGLNEEGPPSTLDLNLWRLPIDGGAPSLYLRHAASPAVLR